MRVHRKAHDGDGRQRKQQQYDPVAGIVRETSVGLIRLATTGDVNRTGSGAHCETRKSHVLGTFPRRRFSAGNDIAIAITRNVNSQTPEGIWLHSFLDRLGALSKRDRPSEPFLWKRRFVRGSRAKKLPALQNWAVATTGGDGGDFSPTSLVA